MLRPCLALLLLSALAHAADIHVRVDPNVKTGIESTTEYPTIQMALDHHPFATPNADGKPGRVYIEIAPGTYRERIIVTQNHTNITLLGMGKGPEDVVITNSLNAKQAGGTFFTETAEINGDGFEADNVTFVNTAGNTGQAVAAAVRADRAIFKHCRFLGHQDTLFADYGRQYYVDSYIEGGVDFIFGNAAAVFDRSEFHANGPGYLTAQSRTSADQPTGYVIVNSRVTVDPPARPVCVSCGGMAPPGPLAASDSGKPPKEALSVLVPIRPSLSLGRPWRPYSRVIVMHTELPADLNPAGWSLWKPTDPLPPPAYYAEFENSGPGASLSARVSWSHRLTPAQAKQYLPASFLGGPKAGPSHWDPLAEAARLP